VQYSLLVAVLLLHPKFLKNLKDLSMPGRIKNGEGKIAEIFFEV